ncbi:HAD-like protein [Hesseltinella vesiculosa]|uniref:Mitochondrial import inner membrane translocase subunit TIM50 n=1 Tax=Hesseltinella vesiculosa TaxID=101127 RepID=A0A1X2GCE1_9FUNG|nr:HAD-like protein [Hesseltinella vesiculosa]
MIGKAIATKYARQPLAQALAKEKKPSSEYLKIANASSTTLDEPLDAKKQLLILDLNGALVSRLTKSSLYLRPGHMPFFDYVFKHFTVMVWSSAQPHNVEKMCWVFGDYKQQLRLMWTRMDFGLSTTDYNRKTVTLKDLTKVWAALPEFDASNTILVDDSTQKTVLQPYNHILVREFDHRFDYVASEGDNELSKVQLFLEKLRRQDNVCNYMKQHPYSSSSPDLVARASMATTVALHYVFTPAGKVADRYPIPHDFSNRADDDLANLLQRVNL